jgi:hypothetical protein
VSVVGFDVTFTDTQPLALHIRDFGGATGYLNAWDEIAQLSDLVQREEKMGKTSRKARELRIVLNSAIDNLVRLLYRSVSEKETHGETAQVEILDAATEIDFAVEP